MFLLVLVDEISTMIIMECHHSLSSPCTAVPPVTYGPQTPHLPLWATFLDAKKRTMSRTNKGIPPATGPATGPPESTNH